MRISISLLLVLLVCCSSAPRSPSTPTQNQVDLSRCRFRVSEPYNSGYADFSLIFSFRLSSSGAPSDLKIFVNLPRIPEEEIRQCVKSWRFPSSNDSGPLLASFRWEHNRGWIVLRITDSSSEILWDVELTGRT